MAVKASNIERKYKAIRTEYEQLISVRELGKRKYTTAVIIAKLALKYYLSEKQIENIVWQKD